MKNILNLAFVFLFSFQINAQNVIEKYFSTLSQQEEATHISLTGKLFEMINSMNIESEEADVEEMSEFLSSIRAFELVSAKHLSTARRSYYDGLDDIGKEFEELITITGDDGYFSLLVDETNGTVHELVGLGAHEEDMIVFSVLGSMKLEQVGKIAQHINSEGLGQLSKIKDLSLDEIKVYPNPVKSSGEVNVKLPKGLESAEISLIDAEGKLVRTIKNGSKRFDIDGLASGSYFVHIQEGEVSVKKKLIIIQ